MIALVPMQERNAQTIDRVSGKSEHGRKQSDRGDHDHEHGHGCADGQALDELQTYEEESEQGDNDSDTGEQNRSARGGDR